MPFIDIVVLPFSQSYILWFRRRVTWMVRVGIGVVEKRMGGVLWYSRFLYSVVYCILWFSHFFNHRFSGYIRYFVPPRYGYQVRIYGWYFALFASPSPPSPRSQPPHGAGTDSGKDSGEKFYLMHAIFSFFVSLFLIFVYLAAAERLSSMVIRLRFSFVRTDLRKMPVFTAVFTDYPPLYPHF